MATIEKLNRRHFFKRSSYQMKEGAYAQWEMLRKYMSCMRTIFGVWGHFFDEKLSVDWLTKNQVQDTLERLQVTLDILEGLHLFDTLSSISVATENSGFPHRRHLEDIVQKLNGSIEDDVSQETRLLKKKFLDDLFAKSEINVAFLEKISKAQSIEVLASREVFLPFMFNGINKLKVLNGQKRQVFVCSWEQFVVQGLPVKYVMVFEVSKKWTGDHDDMSQLVHVLREETSLVVKLNELARHIDMSHALIHPKWIGRVIFGPIFMSGLTDDKHQLQEALDGAAVNGEMLGASRIIYEYILSEDEFSTKTVPDSFGRMHNRMQKFGVRTLEPEHNSRGATHVEKHLFAPHSVIQGLDSDFVNDIGHRLNSY